MADKEQTIIPNKNYLKSEYQSLQDSKDPVYQELVTCKVKLLLERAFFGTLIVSLDLVDASSWCKTGATDGRRFYYNRDYVKGLTRPELMFFLGHNILHPILDHLARRGSRNKELWDMATDYVVNAILKHEKLGDMPKGGLYSDQFTHDMSADEVYEILKKNSVQIKLPMDDHFDVDDSDEDGDEDGSGNGGEDGDGEGGRGTADVTVVGNNGKPKLTQEDIERIRAEMKASLLKAAAGAGNIPLGIQRIINELTQPKLDWRTLLDAHIRSAIKDDYTFQRLGRRTWSSGGAIMPAQNYMDRVEVVCAIDASGSTTQQMVTDFLTEVKGIMESFRDYKVTIFCFDTVVYNQIDLTPDNSDEVYSYEIRGGGGTLFEEVFDYMKREEIEPHRLAFFTDGLPNRGWGDDDGYTDVIWIIHGNPKIEAPYGITCHFEDGQG